MAIEQEDLQRMRNLSANSIDNLVGALCMIGLNHVTDMVSDMLHDPDYVKTNGMPSKDSMANQAIDHIKFVFPDMALYNDLFDDDIDTAPKDGVTAFERYVAAMVQQIVKQAPLLVKLDYQPR